MIETKTLQQYYPFSKVQERFLPLLLKEIKFFSLSRGEKLYSMNHRAESTKYLIDGEIKITTDKGREKQVKSISLQSKYPIGDANKSNTMDAVVTSVTADCFQINSTLLDHFLVWSDTHQQVPADSPIRGHQNYDWVLGLLKSSSVQMLPQGNIGELLKSLQSTTVRAGQDVIKQGEEGDYCYLIAKGEAAVYHSENGVEKVIARLQAGDVFGESALVSNEARNASVKMDTDGMLLRLSGAKFGKLLKAHVVRWITAEETLRRIQQGASLVDVRERAEFQQLSIQGCINIPISELHQRITELDKSRSIITCSNLASRCASAAFTLINEGFDVYVLHGGINQLIRTLD